METKFTHSVKVPNQFRKAAKLLKSSMVEHKSLKTQIFNEKHAVKYTKFQQLFDV